MEANINADVLFLDTAFDLYSSVNDTWTTNNNASRIYELGDEIFKMKQGGRSLEDYYSCVKAKWEELVLLQTKLKQVLLELLPLLLAHRFRSL